MNFPPPVTLPAGVNYMFNLLIYTPAMCMASAATMSIVSNDPGTPTVTVTLAGVCGPPNIDMKTPASVIVGNERLNLPSAPVPIPITNAGQSDLVVIGAQHPARHVRRLFLAGPADAAADHPAQRVAERLDHLYTDGARQSDDDADRVEQHDERAEFLDRDSRDGDAGHSRVGAEHARFRDAEGIHREQSAAGDDHEHGE